MTYHVTAKQWDRGWELHIDGLGVTQSHTLTDAERMVRSWLDITRHADAETADLVWAYELADAGLQRELEDVRLVTRQLAAAQHEAGERTRKIIRMLSDRGLKSADIARITDLSKQRISQLLTG